MFVLIIGFFCERFAQIADSHVFGQKRINKNWFLSIYYHFKRMWKVRKCDIHVIFEIGAFVRCLVQPKSIPFCQFETFFNFQHQPKTKGKKSNFSFAFCFIMLENTEIVKHIQLNFKILKWENLIATLKSRMKWAWAIGMEFA